MTRVKAVLGFLLRRTRLGRSLLHRRGLRFLRPYLYRIGWVRSTEEWVPVDGQGRPLPWYTYPMISFLEGRAKPDMAVFEYGSGNSTLWWSSRVARVVACEHDRSWYERTRSLVPANVEYVYCALEYNGDYCRQAGKYSREFDCIVIDGRDRVRCAEHCLGALRADGVVVWDNSDRPQYQEGYDFLRAEGFRRLDFWGFGPAVAEGWCTSVFYRDQNCLGI